MVRTILSIQTLQISKTHLDFKPTTIEPQLYAAGTNFPTGNSPRRIAPC